MSDYPGIRYFLHDGSMLVPQHEASASDLGEMIAMARKAAVEVQHEDDAGEAPPDLSLEDPVE